MLQLSKKEASEKATLLIQVSPRLRRMTGLSSPRLLAGVSVVVLLLMVTEHC